MVDERPAYIGNVAVDSPTSIMVVSSTEKRVSLVLHLTYFEMKKPGVIVHMIPTSVPKVNELLCFASFSYNASIVVVLVGEINVNKGQIPLTRVSICLLESHHVVIFSSSLSSPE